MNWINRIWQCLHDRRYLREKIYMYVHKAVSASRAPSAGSKAVIDFLIAALSFDGGVDALESVTCYSRPHNGSIGSCPTLSKCRALVLFRDE